MAKEVSFPGLKEHIEDIYKLTETVKVLSENLLKTAVAGEESMKPYKNASGLKTYIEVQEKQKQNTEAITEAEKKLIAAEEKLKFAQSDTAKKLAEYNLQIQKQNGLNKESAKANSEQSSALDKLNAQISQSTRESKEYGAQMVLLEQEGKQLTAEYEEVRKKFLESSDVSKTLQDRFRDISKEAGDNRALVGSYSDELKGHFSDLGNNISSLKDNISSGNFSAVLQDGKEVAVGFKQGYQAAKDSLSNLNTTVVNSAKNVLGLSKASDTAKISQKGLTEATEISTIATNENSVAEKASIGFSTAAKTAATSQTAATVAETTAKNASSVASKGLATSQITLAGASETAAVAETTAAGATGVLNVALGILLAPITLIVAGIAALIYIFKQFTPIVDIVEQAVAGISAAFNVVKNSIIGLVTGAKSLSETFSGLGSSMKDAAVAAAQLKKAQQDLEDNMEGQSIQNAKIQGQIEALIIQSKDRTKTEEQRLSALRKAEELEKQNYSQRAALAKEDLRIAEQVILQKAGITRKEELELRLRYKNENDFFNAFKSLAESRTTNVDEEFKKFKESLSGYYEVLNEHNKFTEKTVNANNKIIEKGEADREKMEKKREEEAKKAKEKREKDQKEAEDHAKKTIELTLNAKKTEIDSLVSGYSYEENLAEDNIKFVENIAARKYAISQLELQKNLIGVKKNSDDYKLIVQKSEEDQKKIISEKENAVKKIRSDNAKFELELYDYNQKSVLEGVKKLTDEIVKLENDRLTQVLEVHKKALLEEFKIDEEKLNAKIKNNEKLTQNEFKYLQAVKKQNEETNKAIKKNSEDLLSYKLKVIDEEEKRNVKNFKQKTKDSNAQRANELSEQRNALQKQLSLYKSGSKEEMDINEKLKDNNFYINELIKNSKIESLNAGLDFFINISGEESKLGKALATLKVTMDTYEKASSAFNTGHLLASNPVTAALAPNAYIQGGLIIAGGLLKVSQINGISLFAEGSDYVPYTGLAIKDELGPELHLNRFGKIKSWGSDKGAHFEHVETGDQIIPADITAMIKNNVMAEPMRRIHILDLNNTNVDSRIDYDEMEKRFDKTGAKIVSAIKNNRTNITINSSRGQDFYNRVRHIGKKV